MLSKQKRRRHGTAPLQRGRKSAEAAKHELREGADAGTHEHTGKTPAGAEKVVPGSRPAAPHQAGLAVADAKEAAKASMAGGPKLGAGKAPPAAAPGKADDRLKPLPIHR